MTDVPDSTLEAEQDLDYTQSYNYDYGLVDEGTLVTQSIATASTQATTVATGEGLATSTATATTDATTQAIGNGATTATAFAQTSASTTATSTVNVSSVATATTDAQTVVSDAELVQSAVEWRVTRDGEFVEDTVFDVDPVVDTANPFGDYAVIKMDDSNGEKFENYARGTRVDVAVSENFGITFENRFTGYVVERRETEQNGADVLEVEAYSFDQFLRRNTVTNDQQGNTIAEALEDIITTDTPVTYVVGNIDVGDEQELTRSYQGEAVETVGLHLKHVRARLFRFAAFHDVARKATVHAAGCGFNRAGVTICPGVVHGAVGVRRAGVGRYGLPGRNREVVAFRVNVHIHARATAVLLKAFTLRVIHLDDCEVPERVGGIYDRVNVKHAIFDCAAVPKNAVTRHACVVGAWGLKRWAMKGGLFHYNTREAAVRCSLKSFRLPYCYHRGRRSRFLCFR